MKGTLKVTVTIKAQHEEQCITCLQFFTCRYRIRGRERREGIEVITVQKPYQNDAQASMTWHPGVRREEGGGFMYTGPLARGGRRGGSQGRVIGDGGG